MKVRRVKQPVKIEYYGGRLRIEKYEDQDEISIWDTRSQMPPYGRLDIDLDQLKHLAKVLPEFIKATGPQND